MKVLLIILAAIFILLVIPLRVRFLVTKKKQDFRLCVLFFRFDITKLVKRLAGTAEKSLDKTAAHAAEKPKRFAVDVKLILHNLDLVRQIVSSAFSAILPALTLDYYSLYLRIYEDDPMLSAELYGMLCTAVYGLLARIESVMRVKRRQVRLDPAFYGETELYIEGTVSTCLLLQAIAATRLLALYIKNKKFIKRAAHKAVQLEKG